MSIETGRPRLCVDVTKSGDHRISLAPRPGTGQITVEEPDPGRLSVFVFTSAQRQMAKMLGLDGLVVPEEGKEHLRNLLPNMQSLFDVHADLSFEAPGEKPDDGNLTMFVQLRRRGSGLKMRVRVYPAGPEGPSMPPGRGRANLLLTVDDKPIQVKRDLAAEAQAETELIEQCEVLDSCERVEADYVVEAPRACLTLLEQLQGADPRPVLQWPHGTPIRVLKLIRPPELTVAREPGSQWFVVGGEAVLDDGRVIKIADLLAANREDGRFVELGDGAFVALTDELSRALAQLEAIATPGDGDTVRVPEIAVGFLDFLQPDHPFRAKGAADDPALTSLFERIKKANALTPTPGDGFNGTLRNYQLEGYGWLHRLSHWAVALAWPMTWVWVRRSKFWRC